MSKTIKEILQRRDKDVDKHDFGHVLVIAGSPRMLGASALCCLAAMRSGAGMVTAAVPKSLNKTLQAKMSHVVMTWPLPETTEQTFSPAAIKDIGKSWGKYQAVILGPGLSQHAQAQNLILKVIELCPVPLVVDADALRVLSGHLNLLSARKAATILTPHLGEMASLTNLTKDQINKKREKICRDFAKAYACVVVLKGHQTVVAQQGQPLFLNPSGNSGMATAGSGDVLAGMIGALLAQGLDAFQSAKYGVYFHGRAGDLAAKDKTRVSMIATDIIENIPAAIKLK